MSNKIQIKTGSGKPGNGKLLIGELGYDKTNGYLYIGNASNQTAGLKVDYAASANYAASAASANYAASADYANYIHYKDTRDENVSPDNSLSGLSVHLKTNGTDSLSDGGSYHAVISVKDWSDYSGGPYWQASVSANNNMYFRRSTSGTTWGAWQKVLSDNNYTSYTVTKTGSGASGTWGISISGNAATADKLGANGGSNTQPVYFTGGKPVICTGTLSNSISGTAAYADKLNANAGSTTKPIYFTGGKPKQCSDTIAVNITGNAATATRATSATSATSATTATTATKLSSTLAVGSGGTGATTADAARANLGLKYTQILAAGSWATSCSWSGNFDFIVGLAAPDNDSTMSKVSFVIPKAFLGSTFQVADDTTYSAFSTAATSITYSKGHQGRLSCVFGVKVG